jgi:hypothetical protein
MRKVINILFLLILYCYSLSGLIPCPGIPSKFGMDNVIDDEVISGMEGTTQDSTNGMELDLDEVNSRS